MGSAGKGKRQFTGNVTEAQYAYLEARGRRLDWSVNKIGTRIMAMWFAAGCPPFSEADATLPKLPFHEEESPEISEEIPYVKRVVT